MKRWGIIFLLFWMLLIMINTAFVHAQETATSSIGVADKNDLKKIRESDLLESGYVDERSSSIEISSDSDIKGTTSSYDSSETSESSETTNKEADYSESAENKERNDQTEQSMDEAEFNMAVEAKKNKLVARDAETLVGNWANFVSAVRNENITKITLTASFSNPSSSDGKLSGYQRKNSLEINGQGNRVDFKNSSINLGRPSNSIGLFHMHDIVINQNYGGGTSEDIVGTRLNSANGSKWKYRFGNIRTEPGVQRLARASHSEIRIYGKMDIDTRAENFYVGSLIMEDGTDYRGNVNHYNFSVFWYNNVARAGSTGASREFTIGKNCRVNVGQTQTSGRTYPAVYHHYLALTVGENSVYNVDMPGNAVRFDDEGAGMTIKKGAVVNLTSKQPAGSVVAFSANNTYINAEPESFFYVIGTSDKPLINLAANGTGTADSRRTGNTFTLNSPAQYDLRNLKDGQTAVNVAAKNDANNTFTILNSDIDLWRVSVPVLGPSSLNYTKVAKLRVDGNGTKEMVSTSTAGLNQFSQADYRRISGMNQNPKIQWIPITDADKTMRARVIIGEVPDNNGLVGGTIKYIPVYASTNQAKVTFSDTYGEVRTNLSTNASGYISYTDQNNPIKFQKAGEIISGVAQRGPWITANPIETTVIDVTPPEPAKVDHADAIQSITTKLTGTGEPKSIITLTVNDQPAGIPIGVVGDDGKWELDISSLSLVTGDILQVFLRDQSGGITQLSTAEKPSTNNAIGNINPKTDMSYRDATFKAATKITVVGGTLSLMTVPDKLEFGNHQVSNKTENYRPTITGDLVVSDTRGSAKKPWRLTLSQSEVLKNGSILLENDLYYNSDLGEKTITTTSQIVESGQFVSDGAKNISTAWQGDYGFKLAVPVEKQRVGEYLGKLSWKLEDVPEN